MSVSEAMEPCLEFGKACRPTRGEDRVFGYELAGGPGLLVGVADGLSSANGRAAAEWIEQTMRALASGGKEIHSAHKLFNRFCDALSTGAHPAGVVDSLSTLSCGICQLKSTDNE